MTKPVLLIDVDGVLCPYFSGKPEPGYERLELGPVGVWINPQHGAWLRELGESYELVWATTWEHDAAELLAPALGLPDMPVIEFVQGAANKTWKIADIDAYLGDRRAAWLDDELGPDADVWAEKRGGTLLIRIDATRGLDESHVAQLRDFAAAT